MMRLLNTHIYIYIYALYIYITIHTYHIEYQRMSCWNTVSTNSQNKSELPACTGRIISSSTSSPGCSWANHRSKMVCLSCFPYHNYVGIQDKIHIVISKCSMFQVDLHWSHIKLRHFTKNWTICWKITWCPLRALKGTSCSVEGRPREVGYATLFRGLPWDMVYIYI